MRLRVGLRMWLRIGLIIRSMTKSLTRTAMSYNLCQNDLSDSLGGGGCPID